MPPKKGTAATSSASLADWAAKRQAKIEAAKKKKEERDDVTDDHTFQPKRRPSASKSQTPAAADVSALASAKSRWSIVRGSTFRVRGTSLAATTDAAAAAAAAVAALSGQATSLPVQEESMESSQDPPAGDCVVQTVESLQALVRNRPQETPLQELQQSDDGLSSPSCLLEEELQRPPEPVSSPSCLLGELERRPEPASSSRQMLPNESSRPAEPEQELCSHSSLVGEELRRPQFAATATGMLRSPREQPLGETVRAAYVATKHAMPTESEMGAVSPSSCSSASPGPPSSLDAAPRQTGAYREPERPRTAPTSFSWWHLDEDQDCPAGAAPRVQRLDQASSNAQDDWLRSRNADPTLEDPWKDRREFVENPWRIDGESRDLLPENPCRSSIADGLLRPDAGAFEGGHHPRLAGAQAEDPAEHVSLRGVLVEMEELSNRITAMHDWEIERYRAHRERTDLLERRCTNLEEQLASARRTEMSLRQELLGQRSMDTGLNAPSIDFPADNNSRGDSGDSLVPVDCAPSWDANDGLDVTLGRLPPVKEESEDAERVLQEQPNGQHDSALFASSVSEMNKLQGMSDRLQQEGGRLPRQELEHLSDLIGRFSQIMERTSPGNCETGPAPAPAARSPALAPLEPSEAVQQMARERIARAPRAEASQHYSTRKDASGRLQAPDAPSPCCAPRLR